MGTIKFNLERLKAVCFYAESRGEVISNQVKNLTKGVKKHATDNVYLTLEDIDKIIALEIEDKELDIARDWLVISCFIGQRSISLLNLTRENINRPQLLITLKQVKTGVNVTIPILPQVQTILDKYNVNFPPRLKQTDRYNYHQYNTLIKQVCKLANISEVSKGRGRKGEGIMSKVVSKPKHELITSHIGRRSFATNFYGKMNMQSIMAITGHKTESSFLLYINKGRVVDTDALRKEFLKALC
jgi:integrase